MEPGESTDCIHGSPSASLTAEANPSDDVAMNENSTVVSQLENSTVVSQLEDNGRSGSRFGDTMAMDLSTGPVQGTPTSCHIYKKIFCVHSCM